VLRANSYADLLEPIDKASEFLRALDAERRASADEGRVSSRAIITITITITIIIAAGIIIITTITTSIFATDRTGSEQHSVAGRFAAFA
jgi:hypothetical protein